MIKEKRQANVLLFNREEDGTIHNPTHYGPLHLTHSVEVGTVICDTWCVSSSMGQVLLSP